MPNPTFLRIITILAFGWSALALAGSASLTIDVSKPGVTVSPLLYGIFFEDINRSGDGGLYAEMLQNRSFEDFNLPMGWTLLNDGNGQATMTLDTSQPLNEKNPTSLRFDIVSTGTTGKVGVINQGYKGLQIDSKDPVVLPDSAVPDAMPANPKLVEWMKRFADAQKRPDNGLNIEEGKSYHLSFYARTAANFSGPVTASLERQDGSVLASAEIHCTDPAWNDYTAKLIATASDKDARFVLSSQTTGTFWIDQVSLFPTATFMQRPNGLRADLMQMLVAMHPAFVRFPGGSFGEGYRLSEAFRWKETIGDLAARPGQWNIWGYRTTNGLGYYEYLQMCEDLKAEPLFVINCGMAEKDSVDAKDFDPWIQDALDAINYANGPATSVWGAQRSAAGHPAPFNLKLMELGNENGMVYSWGGGNAQQYAQRYNPLYEKVKAVFPKMRTISTAPIQKPPINAPVETVDEHYYPTAEWFEDHASMYDTYDRSGPKIYVGEYATKPGAGNGNLNAALGEAAFMTGMERNSDLVIMSSYAPLFVNPQWREWIPNLIVFDSSRVYGTPSYYNQVLFATNRPDVILPLDLKTTATTDARARKPLYAVAGRKNETGEIIVKVVNISGTTQESTIKLQGAPISLHGTATVLTSDEPGDENSFDNPMRISPKKSDLGQVLGPLNYTFAPYSITVLSLKIK